MDFGGEDENLRPEDLEYAIKISKDIEKWICDRYKNNKLESFKQSDCKESFMTISEKYISLACKQLIEKGFITVKDIGRISTFAITEKTNVILRESIKDTPPEEVVKKVSTKKKRKREDGGNANDEYEEDDEIEDFTCKKAAIDMFGEQRTKPFRSMFEAIYNENMYPSSIGNKNIIVRELAAPALDNEHNMTTTVSSSTAAPSANAALGTVIDNEDKSVEILKLLTENVNPDTQSINLENFRTILQTRGSAEINTDIDLHLNQILEQLSRMNKIMIFDGEIFVI
jgi:hypothetical protein